MVVSLQESKEYQVLLPQTFFLQFKPMFIHSSLENLSCNLSFNYVAIQVAQKLATAVVRISCPEINMSCNICNH